MSEENVHTLKRLVAANNRGDFDAFLEECDPGIEWRAVFRVMFGEQEILCRGHEEVRRYQQDLDEAFTTRHVDISEYRDLGDQIVGIGHARGHGRESGVVLDTPYSFVAEFKEGRVLRLSDYLDSAEALEAAERT